jgi:solute carrier family 45 protein 1/2/4
MSSNRPPLASPRPRGILKNASYHRHPRTSSSSLDIGKEQQDQDETSPLIAPPRAESVESPLTLSNLPSPVDSEDWNDPVPEETKSSWYLFLLTLSIGGLQIAWSVELSNGSVSFMSTPPLSSFPR